MKTLAWRIMSLLNTRADGSLVGAQVLGDNMSDATLIALLITSLLLGATLTWLLVFLLPRFRQNRTQNTSGHGKGKPESTRESESSPEQQYDEIQEARRAFTANVSHELKTPLTVISGYAELLEGGLVKPEDITHVSSLIHEEANYMLSLVDDILTLSRLDEYIATGNTSAHATSVDLAEVAARVLHQLEPFARQNSVQCSLSTSGDTRVNGIERLLTSVVYNLSENAIRYNVPDGSMSVVIEGSEHSVRLEVSDTGQGIEEEDQPRVFERFYRIDPAHSRHSGGTGLGLAIVKHGAQYHNASLSLVSTFGVGTTVTVEFPRKFGD